MDSFLPRNVVVTFDTDLTAQFIQWSKKINNTIPSKIVLNTSDTIPHMTLYTTDFPKKNEEKVKEKLTKIAERFNTLPLHFRGKSVILGTIFVDAYLSSDLYRLHEMIVDELNPLREGYFDKNELTLPGFTEGMKKSIVDYGMWAAKKLYIPHVTIARPFEVEACEKALGLIPETIDITTSIRSICFVERGPNGTCKSILQTSSLKD